MTNELTFGLLPERRVNYRSLTAAFVLESVLVAVLIQLGVVQPAKVGIAATHMVITHLTLLRASPEAAADVPIREYIPTRPTKPRVPREPRLPLPNSPRLAEPPTIASSAALPALVKPSAVPPRAVQTDSFLSVSAKPIIEKPVDSSKVQTGGFGDPNGIAAKGNNSNHGMIASLGGFDLPAGRGRGNGRGGTQGMAAVGTSSGFADVSMTAAPHQWRSSTSSAPTTPIEILAKPKPDYSEEGRQLRLEGEVQLEVVFTATGEAHAVKVIRGLGHGLDEKAMRAAEQIKFRPAMHQGRPVDSTAVVHIIFELAS
jgi:TonB family protein